MSERAGPERECPGLLVSHFLRSLRGKLSLMAAQEVVISLLVQDWGDWGRLVPAVGSSSFHN